MTKKKPAPSRHPDRHTKPRFTFHVDEDVLAALNAYRESIPHAPGLSAICRDLLREAMQAKGFLGRV